MLCNIKRPPGRNSRVTRRRISNILLIFETIVITFSGSTEFFKTYAKQTKVDEL